MIVTPGSPPSTPPTKTSSKPSPRRNKRITVLLAAAGVFACTWAAATSTHAQETESAPKTLQANGSGLPDVEEARTRLPGLSSVDQLKLITRFVKAARYDEAQSLLDAATVTTEKDRVYAKYLQARIDYGRGEHKAAIQKLREIVNIAPKFTEARLVLAKMLYETEQDQSAKHHFQLLQGEAVNRPGLGQEVASYINAIDQRKKFFMSGYLSLAPSTNINNGTDAKVIHVNGLPFVIDDDDRKKSGVGLATGLQAGYRMPVTERLDVITTVTLEGKFYEDSDFNVASASLSTGPKLHFNWGSVGAFVLGSLGYAGNQSNNNGWGGMATLQARLSDRDIFSGSAHCIDRSYSTDFKGYDLSYRDGFSCFANGRVEHFFAAGRAARIMGGAGRSDAQLDHLKYDQWSAGVGAYGNIPLGFVLDLEVNYTARDYKGIAPGATSGRKDDEWRFSANLMRPAWNVAGFAPQLNYTYTVNNSNVDFHDYDSHGVNLTLSKNF